jgi:hypothetical protein
MHAHGIDGWPLTTSQSLFDQGFWNARIAAVQTQGLSAIGDPVLKRWFSSAFRSERPADVAGWRDMLVRTPAAGYAATCAAIRDADLAGDATKIKVLLCSWLAARMAQRLPIWCERVPGSFPVRDLRRSQAPAIFLHWPALEACKSHCSAFIGG